MVKTSDYDLDLTGNEIVTEKLQKAIDIASLRNEILVISKGIYLISNIYLKSNMQVIFEDGAVLLGTTKEDEYKIIDTRAAGLNMKWFGGILNIIDCENVSISGHGIINGSGPYWWSKYWGKDMHGGMREVYDQKNVRFLCDYDCRRPRNVLVQNSSNIRISDIESFESGFWNIHILYSHDIEINNIYVNSFNENSPSTDGLDIDSSYNVRVSNSLFECNDDSIAIKSGRDYDGIITNRPSYNIAITKCEIRRGFGITLGSEISGGVYDIDINNIKYIGTDCGFRIKSSKKRKGYIRNIRVSNLDMKNVKYVFHIFLDWNPLYNKCEIPADYDGRLLDYVKLLLLDTEGRNTIVENIDIDNVKASNCTRCFNIIGYDDEQISGLSFKNLAIDAIEYGIIKNCDDIKLVNCNIKYKIANDDKNNDYDNR